jgi:hypothetical protein
VLQQCQLLKGEQSSALLRIYLIMLMMTVKYYKQMCSLSLSLSLSLSSRVCIIIIIIIIIIAGVVFLLRPSSVETNTRRNSNNMPGLAWLLGRERREGGCLPAAAPIATC